MRGNTDPVLMRGSSDPRAKNILDALHQCSQQAK